MPPRESSRRWTYGAGMGLLLLLLVVQVVQAVEGFIPHRGVLGALELPGTLLGWGGVTVVAFALAWMVLGWWGQGFTGVTLRLLGAVALGVAMAGLLGLAAGSAGGGRVGQGIGTLLRDVLGVVPAVLVLLLMGVPGFLLAAAPFWAPRREEAGPTDVARLHPPPGVFEGSASPRGSPYPERRYDEGGNEIPMALRGSDVGPIRYRDERTPEDDAPPPPPPPVEVEPPEAGLPEGIRFADEPEPEGPPGPALLDVEYGHPDVPLPPGVRFRDAGAPEPEDEEAEDEDEVAAGPAAEPEAEPEPEPAPRPAPPARPAPKKAAAPPAARAPEPVTSPPERTGPHPTEEETVSRAMSPLHDQDAAARYRAKLEGSGIFDDAPPRPAPVGTGKADTQDAEPSKATPSGEGKRRPRRKAKRKASREDEAAEPPAKKRPAGSARGGAKRPAKGTSRRKAAPEPPQEEAAAEPAPSRKGAAAPAGDLFSQAVEIALERGAASSVLLSRRLKIGYARARSLLERLAEDGIVGEMSPSGSRPVLIDAQAWARRRAGGR